MTALQAARQRVEDYIASEPKPNPLLLKSMLDEMILSAKVEETRTPF
jgi:hypothetical protein